jgi:hypothetical protein
MLYEVVILEQTNKVPLLPDGCNISRSSNTPAASERNTINQSDLQQQTKIKDSRNFLNPTQNERNKERMNELRNATIYLLTYLLTD